MTSGKGTERSPDGTAENSHPLLGIPNRYRLKLGYCSVFAFSFCFLVWFVDRQGVGPCWFGSDRGVKSVNLVL